jgi:hypothetical protein
VITTSWPGAVRAAQARASSCAHAACPAHGPGRGLAARAPSGVHPAAPAHPGHRTRNGPLLCDDHRAASTAVMVCAASAIDGTSTTVTPPSASSAATTEAINVFPVPHAARSCPRPPPPRPALIAVTTSA